MPMDCSNRQTLDALIIEKMYVCLLSEIHFIIKPYIKIKGFNVIPMTQEEQESLTIRKWDNKQ